MPSSFPNSQDVFLPIPVPTVTLTNLQDATDLTLSQRLQQHSDCISSVETFLLGNGSPLLTLAQPTTLTANTYNAVSSPGTLTVYLMGLLVGLAPDITNTGPSVLNLNGLGQIPIVTPSSAALMGGELPANSIIPLYFDGANFRIIGNCPLSSIGILLNTTYVVPCAGYTSIAVSAAFTVGSSLTVVLNNVTEGVPINLFVVNQTGNPAPFSLTITSADGVPLPSVNVLASSASGAGYTNIASTFGSISINNNSAMSFIGALVHPSFAILAH